MRLLRTIYFQVCANFRNLGEDRDKELNEEQKSQRQGVKTKLWHNPKHNWEEKKEGDIRQGETL